MDGDLVFFLVGSFCFWNNKELKICTKVRVCRAVVFTTLLYGSESWVPYRCHLRFFECIDQHCLSTILNIYWSDYITNTENRDRAKIAGVQAILLET